LKGSLTMDSINVNLDNLTQSEREQLMKLVEKGNKNKSKVWKPAMGEEYFSIGVDGDILCGPWENDSYDLGAYSMGNCYPTEEAAEFAIEKQKILTELQRYADEYNDKIDWDNDCQNKYYIFYDHSEKKIEIHSNQYLQSNAIYFTTQTIGFEAVEAIGEGRIKKYLFNVGT